MHAQRVRRLLTAAVVAVGVSCSGTDEPEPAPSAAPASTTTSIATTIPTPTTVVDVTAAPTTSTTWPRPVPVLAQGVPVRVVRTPAGVVAPVVSIGVNGDVVVRTPCGAEATVLLPEAIDAVHVVIDPGHGGVENGAVGPGGLREADLNLAVSELLRDELATRGITAVLTRESDYRITLATRAEIATALAPLAFVSIHHNAAPDGASAGPGTETYYQIDDPSSRRLAGLVLEDVRSALDAFDAAWVADSDAGAKYRLNSRGGDYYGILRQSAGVPAVLVEAAFLSNPSEERLLLDPAVQLAEAVAVADALERFLRTDDPGSGFVEPYERTEPAGSGGGASGCVDPPLD